ncbi:MAG TPA: phosphopantetheine-binding protein [Burkholderiales bacterium]|jgi:acyl carrier protein|nr:phosphopantetheine-binding protein [Burkholderiales bacterium]
MAIQENGSVKESLRRFIQHSVQLPQLADDEDLFATGIVNSLFAVQLVTFIEKTFGLEVDAEDLEIRNFRSLNAATAFVEKKTQYA